MSSKIALFGISLLIIIQTLVSSKNRVINWIGCYTPVWLEGDEEALERSAKTTVYHHGGVLGPIIRPRSYASTFYPWQCGIDIGLVPCGTLIDQRVGIFISSPGHVCLMV